MVDNGDIFVRIGLLYLPRKFYLIFSEWERSSRKQKLLTEAYATTSDESNMPSLFELVSPRLEMDRDFFPG